MVFYRMAIAIDFQHAIAYTMALLSNLSACLRDPFHAHHQHKLLLRELISLGLVITNITASCRNIVFISYITMGLSALIFISWLEFIGRWQ